MSANSKTRNPEAEGRKFWAVVCVCVAGLISATLLTIGLNSAKADVADVEFDAVSIKQGAKLAVNGTHIITAGRDNQLLAEETSDEEVLSEQTDGVLASFAEEKYQQDPVVEILTNAGYPTRAYISENFAYISNTSLSYWLQDTRSFHGVSTRSWRTTDNKASVVKVPMNGKAPDGTLFTSADGTTVDTKDYDFETDTTFADYNVKAGEMVHSIYSQSVASFDWRTSSSIVIEDGTDVWNNPFLLDDNEQGYYKTRIVQVGETFHRYEVYGRVVFEKAADGTVNPFIEKVSKGQTYKKGDILVSFATWSSGVLPYLENEAEGFRAADELAYYPFYFKALN